MSQIIYKDNLWAIIGFLLTFFFKESALNAMIIIFCSLRCLTINIVRLNV